jgi:hypothetical protein
LSELSLPAVSVLSMESAVAVAVKAMARSAVRLEAIADTHCVVRVGNRQEIFEAAR